MTTRLDKPIKREITAKGETLVLKLGPEGVTITPKGRRKGKTFTWAELWSGEQGLSRRSFGHRLPLWLPPMDPRAHGLAPVQTRNLRFPRR